MNESDTVAVLRPPLALRLLLAGCALFSVGVSVVLLADGIVSGLQLASSSLVALLALAFLVGRQPIRFVSDRVEYCWAFGSFETPPTSERIRGRRFVVLPPPPFLSGTVGGRAVGLGEGGARIGAGIHLSRAAAADLASILNDHLDRAEV